MSLKQKINMEQKCYWEMWKLKELNKCLHKKNIEIYYNKLANRASNIKSFKELQIIVFFPDFL